MKITVCLIFLLQRFAYYKHLQVIFSTEKQEFEKRTQMHVSLECSSQKYMHFPKLEALADLYFRALHSRFTCICVLFQYPVFQ